MEKDVKKWTCFLWWYFCLNCVSGRDQKEVDFFFALVHLKISQTWTVFFVVVVVAAVQQWISNFCPWGKAMQKACEHQHRHFDRYRRAKDWNRRVKLLSNVNLMEVGIRVGGRRNPKPVASVNEPGKKTRSDWLLFLFCEWRRESNIKEVRNLKFHTENACECNAELH